MPIDAAIPLQVQPLKLESPMNQLAMMGEAAKLGEYRQLADEKNALRQRMAQGDFDISNPAHQRELYAIAPTTAPKLIGEMAITKKNLAQGNEAEYNTQVKKMDKAITDIANHDTPQSALASIQDSVNKGILAPEKGQMLIDQLKSMPFERFQMTQIKNLVGAKDRLSLDEQSRHNRTTEGIAGGHLQIARENQNRGVIPAGYRMAADGKTLEAIPGGPTTTPLAPKELQAREGKYPMATQAVKTVESKADKLVADIETLKNHPGLDSITGTIYGRTPSATKEGRAAQALYDSIVARGGFQELAAMRAASPTGGALGNVSNQEGQQLKDAFGTLNRTQDAADLRTQLGRVADDVRGAKQRVREAYDMTYDYKAGSAPTTPAASGKDDPLGIR